jgi:hypothetical protein
MAEQRFQKHVMVSTQMPFQPTGFVLARSLGIGAHIRKATSECRISPQSADNDNFLFYLHYYSRIIVNMSDSGEVEVESPSTGYQVLPKEVTSEIGSIKLFNKWSYEDVEIRDISLTYETTIFLTRSKKFRY